MILNLFKKFKSIIIYGVVGCMSTAINIGVYLLLYDVLKIQNVPSNVCAWIVSVVFAFFANKLFVFESKNMSKTVVLAELCKFCLARLGTGLVDLLIMFVTVDCMSLNAALWKVISNIIVIVGNYILSKFVVFKKCDHNSEEV